MKPWMTFFLGVIAAIAGINLVNHLNINPTTVIPFIIGDKNEVNIHIEALPNEQSQPSADKDKGEEASTDSQKQSNKGPEEAKPAPNTTDETAKQNEDNKVSTNEQIASSKPNNQRNNRQYRNNRSSRKSQHYPEYNQPTIVDNYGCVCPVEIESYDRPPSRISGKRVVSRSEVDMFMRN